jgi:hypothetical protein
METPSTGRVLDDIEAKIDTSWIDPSCAFSMVRDNGSLWMRGDGAGDVIKITVERLPRSAWPRPPS